MLFHKFLYHLISQVQDQGNMHAVNLYKIGDKWYVADFIMTIKNPKETSNFFAIPLERFILSV